MSCCKSLKWVDLITSKNNEIYLVLFVNYVYSTFVTLQSEVHEDSGDDSCQHGDHGDGLGGRGGVALVRGAGVDAGPVLLKTDSFSTSD